MSTEEGQDTESYAKSKLINLLQVVAKATKAYGAPAIIAGNFNLPLDTLQTWLDEQCVHLKDQICDGVSANFKIYTPKAAQGELLHSAPGFPYSPLKGVREGLINGKRVDFFCTLALQGQQPISKLSELSNKLLNTLAVAYHPPQVAKLSFVNAADPKPTEDITVDTVQAVKAATMQVEKPSDIDLSGMPEVPEALPGAPTPRPIPEGMKLPLPLSPAGDDSIIIVEETPRNLVITEEESGEEESAVEMPVVAVAPSLIDVPIAASSKDVSKEEIDLALNINENGSDAPVFVQCCLVQPQQKVEKREQSQAPASILPEREFELAPWGADSPSPATEEQPELTAVFSEESLESSGEPALPLQPGTTSLVAEVEETTSKRELETDTNEATNDEAIINSINPPSQPEDIPLRELLVHGAVSLESSEAASEDDDAIEAEDDFTGEFEVEPDAALISEMELENELAQGLVFNDVFENEAYSEETEIAPPSIPVEALLELSEQTAELDLDTEPSLNTERSIESVRQSVPVLVVAQPLDEGPQEEDEVPQLAPFVGVVGEEEEEIQGGDDIYSVGSSFSQAESNEGHIVDHPNEGESALESAAVEFAPEAVELEEEDKLGADDLAAMSAVSAVVQGIGLRSLLSQPETSASAQDLDRAPNVEGNVVFSRDAIPPPDMHAAPPEMLRSGPVFAEVEQPASLSLGGDGDAPLRVHSIADEYIAEYSDESPPGSPTVLPRGLPPIDFDRFDPGFNVHPNFFKKPLQPGTEMLVFRLGWLKLWGILPVPVLGRPSRKSRRKRD